MKPRHIRAAVAATAMLLPHTVRSQTPDAAGALAAVNRMFEGMRTADSAMVRSVFSNGARFATVDPRTTPAVITYDTVGGWIAAIATSARRWDEQIYDVQVRVDGNIAQVWAPYTFYLDKQVRHCGINAIDLMRDGAGWKVTQIADTRRRENCPDPLAKK